MVNTKNKKVYISVRTNNNNLERAYVCYETNAPQCYDEPGTFTLKNLYLSGEWRLVLIPAALKDYQLRLYKKSHIAISVDPNTDEGLILGQIWSFINRAIKMDIH